MKTVNLRIFTPAGLVYINDVNIIETTTYKGRIGMCANQIQLMALLKPNLTVIKTDQGNDEFYLFGGLVYQKPKKIKIFTNELYKKNSATEKQWLEQKAMLEHKISKTADEVMCLALKHQLHDLEIRLNLISS